MPDAMDPTPEKDYPSPEEWEAMPRGLLAITLLAFPWVYTLCILHVPYLDSTGLYTFMLVFVGIYTPLALLFTGWRVYHRPWKEIFLAVALYFGGLVAIPLAFVIIGFIGLVAVPFVLALLLFYIITHRGSLLPARPLHPFVKEP